MDTIAKKATPPDFELRDSHREQERIGRLFEVIPKSGGSAIDIGARDGYLTLRLVDLFDEVTALDLEMPQIAHPKVRCVKGNACGLEFPDSTFDFVLCAEVLEHIPPENLEQACKELARVTGKHLVIGVPFEQDLRIGRTTCSSCGAGNPPFGHVNTFTEASLKALFSDLEPVKVHRVGSTKSRTNGLAALLYDWAGNPFGTYEQDEPCVHCGAEIVGPQPRSLAKRLCSFAAAKLNQIQSLPANPKPAWIHILFQRKSGS
jgi:ubiquinone/menaquinone biosynthesis C-methylase UbiE